MANNKFGVPCSTMKEFAADADVPCTDEGQAMALAAGALLAGKCPVVYSQNSGLGNMVDIITSLYKPYGIELPEIHIGFRKAPAHHAFMGNKTEILLRDVLEYPGEKLSYHDMIESRLDGSYKNKPIICDCGDHTDNESGKCETCTFLDSLSNELDIEPENRTECPNTSGAHIWLWDKDQEDWQCDECGVYHDRPED